MRTCKPFRAKKPLSWATHRGKMKPAGNTFTSSFFRLWASTRDQARIEQSATTAIMPAMRGTAATRGRIMLNCRFAMTSDVMVVT